MFYKQNKIGAKRARGTENSIRRRAPVQERLDPFDSVRTRSHVPCLALLVGNILRKSSRRAPGKEALDGCNSGRALPGDAFGALHCRCASVLRDDSLAHEPDRIRLIRCDEPTREKEIASPRVADLPF